MPDKATWFKCAPPLRSRSNQDKLWAALKAGQIDGVASDHSPCPPGMKELETGDFMKAWGGIAGAACLLRFIQHIVEVQNLLSCIPGHCTFLVQ